MDAFRSTLEEVADADLILHVVDGSDADPRSQLAAVREVLAEIGAGDVPELVVINKADAADPIELEGAAAGRADSRWWSPPGPAPGIDELLAEIERLLPRHAARSASWFRTTAGDLRRPGAPGGRGAGASSTAAPAPS